VKQINIFALGDSITYGFPYGPRYSWVEMASQKLEIKIINGGINGDTTAFMLQRLPQALSCRPSHLLILGGANDAYWGQPVSSVGLNIKEICQNCRQEGIEAIIGLPTPVDEPGVEVLLSEYRSYFLNIAAAYNNVVIPFHQAFFDSDGRFRAELTTDGCHPNIEGYEAMAEVAEKALMEILA
jgi:lysophospholipase L1-like esterase